MTSPGPLPGPLAEALAAVADLLATARQPWWVIGSAAVALHGAAVEVGDVDVMLAEADAQQLLPSREIEPRPGLPDERFRSTLFARWEAPPLAVEFMCGLHLAEPDGWSAVDLSTRVPVEMAGATVFVPSRAELLRLLHRFGRDKDVARATLLDC